MGLYDRHYVRDRDGEPGGMGGNAFPTGLAGMSGWSFNTWLIVINVAVFVIDVLLAPALHGDVLIYNPAKRIDEPFRMGLIQYVGYFSTATALGHWQLWRLLTFQFLHAHVWHLLFNMLALYWFGPMVEHYLGSRRYLAFYLLSGCGGALLYLVLNVGGLLYAQATGMRAPLLLVNDPRMPLVGASAGIFGVLFAAAYLRPNQVITLLLFFVLPLSMRIRTLAYGLLVIAFFVLYTGRQNAGGEAGHIGGALLGAFLIRRAHWLNWALWLPLDRLKRRGHHAFRRYQAPPATGSFWTDERPAARRPGFFERRRRAREQFELDEVDRILAKIATQGMGSLTDRERGILQRDTERKRSL